MGTFDKLKKKTAKIVDKAQSYDYKTKAEDLKAKANDIATKAKNYDYKAKAEEIKEKAAETTEKIQNIDYKEKACEFSDTVKNYDYKGEAQNIKKGGLKYVLKKYKIFIILIAIVLVIFKCCAGSSHWALRKLDTLEVSMSEVKEAEEKMSDSGEPYSKAAKSIIYDNVKILDYSAQLIYTFNNTDSQVAMMYVINSVDLEDVLRDIEKEIGEGKKKDDIVPNYIWYDDGYTYNLIYSNGNATLVISMNE